VDEIWIPFPDPLPKIRQARHRLVSPLFLERYRRLLRRGGAVHLKTDDVDLVDFAERALRTVGGRLLGGSDNLAGDEDETSVQTAYEKRYRGKGRPIYVRRFCLV
jgi:tRNA (guanine-N7-)-methyltransferase